jgi:hypothetical protein
MMQDAHPLMMFAQGFIFQSISYFAVVGLFYFVLWKWGEERFRGSRIQAKRRVDTKQIAFEVKNTLWVFLISSPVTLVISFLYARGDTKLSIDAAAIG